MKHKIKVNDWTASNTSNEDLIKAYLLLEKHIQVDFSKQDNDDNPAWMLDDTGEDHNHGYDPLAETFEKAFGFELWDNIDDYDHEAFPTANQVVDALIDIKRVRLINPFWTAPAGAQKQLEALLQSMTSVE